MTSEQFQQLLANPDFLTRESSERAILPETVETHISYVILTKQRVYKIKKTLELPFLDFSTIALRQHYCQQELLLNQRMAPQMYLSVIPLKKYQDRLYIGEGGGETIDYTLKMIRMDNDLEMDRMLSKGTVQKEQIISLAQHIATFHQRATVVQPDYSIDYFQALFNPISEWKSYLEQNSGTAYRGIVQRAVSFSNRFLKDHINLLRQRSKNGLVRDVHGDLHGKNIFLTTPPTVFDCIEFDASLRQIDLLSEIAFLCMDLDFWGKETLGQLFYRTYIFNMRQSGIDAIEYEPLYLYFKLCRANVRAKVLLIQAQESDSYWRFGREIERYLTLMDQYLLMFSS